MQTRTLLGTAAVVAGLLWLGTLLLAWSDYTTQSVIAEVSLYVRPAQQKALAATLQRLTWQTWVAGLLVTTGIILLTQHASDEDDGEDELPPLRRRE